MPTFADSEALEFDRSNVAVVFDVDVTLHASPVVVKQGWTNRAALRDLGLGAPIAASQKRHIMDAACAVCSPKHGLPGGGDPA